MTTLSTLGKYLDQPLLLRRLHKAMTPLLVAGAGAYGLYNTYKTPKKERAKQFTKNAFVLSGTVASALIAVRGFRLGKFKIPGLMHHIHKPNTTGAINDFIKKNASKLKDETVKLLKKSREKILGLKQVDALQKELNKVEGGKELFNKIIPPPHEHGFLGEIFKLSVLGTVPVAGGIAGGIAATTVTGENVKEKAKPMIKEGLYQYLANIILCNVGAAAGVGVIEIPPVKKFLKAKNINCRLARIGAMVAGITAVGIAGGSAIANFIGKKAINPLLGDKQKSSDTESAGLTNLYSERHPELVDGVLHVDDFASVGFLSGFNWVGPALPLIYSISGYRAGMGYRNGHGHDRGQHRNGKHHQNHIIGANPLINTVEVNNNAFSTFQTIKQRSKNFLQ